ncbi:MAG: alpha/beta hydrolase [Myxococcales bacterium]|nr:alpha/beta hydrolase [Myxococcales bacterium]
MESRLYEASDSTRLCYEVFGPEDAPPVLLCDGVGCNGYVWKYILRDFSDQYRFIHPYYRGHGSSAIPEDISRLTISNLAEDMVGILAQEGVDEVVLMGHSMGIQVSLEMIGTTDTKVQGLVALCGSYGHPLETFGDTRVLHYVVPVVHQLCRHYGKAFRPIWREALRTPLAWYVATLTEVNPALARKGDFVPYLKHMSEMDPEVFWGMVKCAGRHTGESYLKDIDFPALVIAGDQDGFTPSWLSTKMAAGIAGSALVTVEQGSHIAPLEQPGLVNGHIEKFLSSISWQ